MKKILIRVVIGLVVLLVLAALAVHFFLDGAVKRGVETIGPKLTKVEVKLDLVNLSLLSGSGKMKGLTIGNPKGYHTPHAISVGTASLSLKPGSLLSEKLVIHSINLEAPEITFEGGLSGNNLSKILANLNETTSGSETSATTPKEKKTENKKLQVDDFAITGAKVNANVSGVMGLKSVTVPIPTLHLSNLGTGPEGITVAELTKLVFAELEKEAAKAAATAAADFAKGATGLTKDLGNTLGNTNLSKGLGNLLRKRGTN